MGYRQDLAQAYERVERPAVPVRRVATSAGQVEYTDSAVSGSDPGTGQAVLVLHGAPGGWDQSLEWAGRRLGPGLRVVAPSRFGYLGSALPLAASTEKQADVYAELLDELGLERVPVVSLSAGSISATQFALRHPDRVSRLVLESPVLPSARRPRPVPPAGLVRSLARRDWLFWVVSRRPGLNARAMGLSWRDLDDDSRHELRQVMSTSLPVRPRAEGMVFDNTVAIRDVNDDRLTFERITAPTLIVAAKDSTLPRPDDVAAVAARLPQGQVLAPRTGGHLVLGNIESLRAQITEFIIGPVGR